MDFGRATDLDSVSFAMPPDDPDNGSRLASGNAHTGSTRPLGGVRALVGTPRWADPGFVGTLYPAGTRAAGYLRRYGDQFGTVELNSTFYGVQHQSIERWVDAVPQGFRFCPKVPQRISHDLQLVGSEAESEGFFDAMAGFGDRLGPVWLLLPETFGPDRYAILRAWLGRFSPGRALALEVRHPHWFSHPRARPGLVRMCAEMGVTLMMTDVAGRRDVLHQSLTTGRAMVRFVGNRHHPTDFTRLDAWTERLRCWFDAGLQELYFFLHQPEEALNVGIGEYLIPRLNEACGLAIPPLRRPARQGSLFGG